ncbi:MAG: hypothetical protein GY805_19015 [Chloroflexi bacterium]|nr:hypothetical protein [Chloroflexota bacterium]
MKASSNGLPTSGVSSAAAMLVSMFYLNKTKNAHLKRPSCGLFQMGIMRSVKL